MDEELEILTAAIKAVEDKELLPMGDLADLSDLSTDYLADCILRELNSKGYTITKPL